jgi:hypothetical protein
MQEMFGVSCLVSAMRIFCSIMLPKRLIGMSRLFRMLLLD